MRIALIAPLVAPIGEPQEGGAQVVVADLARGLVRRGHEVRLYAPAGSGVDGVAVTTLGIAHTDLVTTADQRGALRRTTPALAEAYRQVYDDIGRNPVEVVHNHGFDPPAVVEAAAAGVAALHTLHLPPEETVLSAITTARGGRTPVWCAVVSAAQARAWSTAVTVDEVLSNGVPAAAIAKATAGIEPAPRHAVIASRLSPEKGVAEGIEAARQAGWTVEVIGRDWDPGYVVSLHRRWDHDDAVRFRGTLDRASLWRRLAAAEAVLCLSQWDEPFGMVAAEALAAGTPVVASRRGGLPEVVIDGLTGRLVEDRDIDAAATALSRISAIERRACRRHARAHLDLDLALARHEAAYRRLTSQC